MNIDAPVCTRDVSLSLLKLLINQPADRTDIPTVNKKVDNHISDRHRQHQFGRGIEALLLWLAIGLSDRLELALLEAHARRQTSVM